MNLRSIIIDDEPLAIEIIETFAEKTPFIEIAATFTNPIRAIEFIRSNEIDLIFLDIQMPELTGIQFINTLKETPPIIFTTAYEEFALKGYELEVVDYLLKPFSYERFLQAVNKVYNRTQKKTNASPQKNGSKQSEIEYIFVKTEYRMQKIFLKDIYYIEAMKDYLKIVTEEEGVMSLLSFKKLEAILPDNKFQRVHRSYMVSLEKIESIERNTIKILGERIPISDSYRQNFYKSIGQNKVS